MTPFEEIVGGMRVETSLYARFQLRAPWGVCFHSGDYPRLVIISQGQCRLIADGDGSSVLLPVGTCIILKPHVEFTLVDEPGREITPCWNLLSSHDGRLVEHGGSGAMTELVAGRFSFNAVAAEPLTAAMPSLTHVRLDEADRDLLKGTLRLMGLETARAEFGAGLVIDRLVDALFIQALRAFCAKQGANGAGWFAGLVDKRLEKAIRAAHANLAHSWTVEELAGVAGLSRSSFAASFKAIIGQSPLEYLTGWRMYRAKVLLASSSESLARIALLVGYDNEVSLSRTFRQRFGMPPGKWRQSTQHRAGEIPQA